MKVFKLLLLVTAACAMKLSMTAAPNTTMAPSVTRTGVVQLPRSTVWVTADHTVPLMDSPISRYMYCLPRQALDQGPPALTFVNTMKQEEMLCMILNFWADHRVTIVNGINYLHNRRHVVGLPPGPGACSRFSCADDSGIYACNDNPYPIAVDDRTVANFSLAILNNMSCVDPTSYGDNSQGQAFSSQGWNTIVGQLIGDGWC